MLSKIKRPNAQVYDQTLLLTNHIPAKGKQVPQRVSRCDFNPPPLANAVPKSAQNEKYENYDQLIGKIGKVTTVKLGESKAALSKLDEAFEKLDNWRRLAYFPTLQYDSADLIEILHRGISFSLGLCFDIIAKNENRNFY